MREEAQKSDLVDVDVDLLEARERSARVRVRDTGRIIFLPLSQTEIHPAEDGRHHVATMPAWLATEKGLL